jgi:hypothetical protein
MTARERTAYPRFKQTLTAAELVEFFTLSDAEQTFVKRSARNMLPRLRLSIYFKCFQKLGYLPQLGQVPQAVIDHIALQHQSKLTVPLSDAPIASRRRYRQTIRRFLQVKAYSDGGADAIATVIEQAAFTMSDPADLINVANASRWHRMSS